MNRRSPSGADEETEHPVSRSRARVIASGVSALILVIVLTVALVAITQDSDVNVRAGSRARNGSTVVSPTRTPSGTPLTTIPVAPPTDLPPTVTAATLTDTPPTPTNAPPQSGTITEAFTAPPAWPGNPWTLNGNAVPSSEIVAAAGP